MKCQGSGSARLLNHVAMGVSSTEPSKGSWLIPIPSPAFAALAMSRTVLRFMMSETETEKPPSLSRLDRRIARMESPPSSKKLSNAPGAAAMFSTCSIAAATASSASPTQATCSLTERDVGSGNAFRSIFPLGVMGMASSGI